jgi:hypothetical protein
MTAKSADRGIVLRAYTKLGFFEGQSDESLDVTAADVADEINSIGKLKAIVVKQELAHSNVGCVADSVTFRVEPMTVLPPGDSVGDMLYVLNGANSGYYEITGVYRSTNPGDDYALIFINGSRDYFDHPYDVPNTSWAIVRETVELESKSTALTTAIDIQAASANDILGFTVGRVGGTTTGFQVQKSGVVQNFTSADVVVGDYVQLGVAEYKPTLPHYLVGSLSSPTQIELALGSESVMPYIDPLPQQFVIISADYIAYYQFVQAMNEWRKATEASKYSKDIQELERVMNPLLVNTNPPDSQIRDAEYALGDLTRPNPAGLWPLLLQLSAALTKFVTRTSSRIDAAIKMLQERGFDRAYNTLMDGDLVSFFGYDKDDAASGAYMLKTMRSLAQNDLAVSKSNNTMDDTSLQSSSTTTNPNYDYSDGDKDENISLIGSAPIVDASDPSVPPDYAKTTLG